MAQKQNSRNRFLGFLYRRTERTQSCGPSVALWWATESDRRVVAEKVLPALELLRAHSPKHLDRLNRFADGIFVFACARAAAEWHQALRLVVIDGDFLERPSTNPTLVATTLAHEATHAWLDHLGIPYDEDRRARIEAICARAELACARHMPEPEAAFERANAILQLDPNSWSRENMRAAHVGALIDRGVPAWIANALDWVTRRRAI